MKKSITILLVFLLSGFLLKSQSADVPYHYEPTDVKLGPCQGKKLNEYLIEYSQHFYYQKTKAQTLSFPDSAYTESSVLISASRKAPWIRLRFSEVNLGKNSYLAISSKFNHDVQYFNSQSIAKWENQTALFQGFALEIKMLTAPGDNDISFNVSELTVGEYIGNAPPVDYLCGYDSRYSSSYENVDGRILPIGCTGWISAGGFYVTAGHCLDVTSYDLQVIQFHVPSSLCDGTLVPSAVADQYPIIFSSRVYQNGDTGNDWGIFNVSTNSNTGKTPIQAERSYYHLSKSLAPSNILVRGFGTDQNPEGCTGSYNSSSQTLQYDIGSNLGEYFNGSSDVYFEYLVDTQGGSSGSVLQSNGISGVTRHAIGVHTYGSCNSPNTGNRGTSFEADDTEAAMNSYWQSNCEYVDVDHHFSSTVGSSVLPHESLQTALNQADAGHGPETSALELILVAGSNNGSGGVYDETITYSGASNGVQIRRSAGAIIIGPNADKSRSADLKADTSSYGNVTVIEKDIFNLDQKMDYYPILPGQIKAYRGMSTDHNNEDL